MYASGSSTMAPSLATNTSLGCVSQGRGGRVKRRRRSRRGGEKGKGFRRRRKKQKRKRKRKKSLPNLVF